MYRHRRHASQRRRTSAVQSGLAVKLAIGKVIACWQHLFIGKPTRNRILHQLELDACSTGFSRNRILPAKAGTTNGLRSLMQNPITLRGTNKVSASSGYQIARNFLLRVGSPKNVGLFANVTSLEPQQAIGS